MDDLKIKHTVNTPDINFNYKAGTLSISGRCFTQNILDFYAPARKWIEQYLSAPQDSTTINLKIEYMNSASTVIIANILKQIATISKTGKKVHVNWYYLEGEDDMMDMGKELEVLISIPFSHIASDRSDEDFVHPSPH
jgi:hypothetical protein